MRGHTEIISTSGSDPVTLAEAKAQLRIDFDTDDALIGVYISAARTHCEAHLGFSLVAKSLKTTFNCFGPYQSLMGPLDSITSVKYRDTNRTITTLATDQYTTTTGRTLRLYPATDSGWPDDVAFVPGAVVVEYTVLGDATSNVKAAMLLIITSLYENRDDGVRRFPTASKKLLDMEREHIF